MTTGEMTNVPSQSVRNRYTFKCSWTIKYWNTMEKQNRAEVLACQQSPSIFKCIERINAFLCNQMPKPWFKQMQRIKQIKWDPGARMIFLTKQDGMKGVDTQDPHSKDINAWPVPPSSTGRVNCIWIPECMCFSLYGRKNSKIYVSFSWQNLVQSCSTNF